jgi:6-pyruvoyl-tetrahydropterin synthase
MSINVSVKSSFSAAVFYQDKNAGKSCNIHGHDYLVEVSFSFFTETSILSEELLTKRVRNVLESFDNALLIPNGAVKKIKNGETILQTERFELTLKPSAAHVIFHEDPTPKEIARAIAGNVKERMFENKGVVESVSITPSGGATTKLDFFVVCEEEGSA